MALELKKLAPWNWFRHEENESANSPGTQALTPYADNPLAQFHQQVDQLFNNVVRSMGMPSWFGGGLSASNWLRPNVDIAATDKQYTITIEVPGVEENEVALELIDDSLIIRGEKKLEKEQKDKEFYRVERSYGSFRRVLSLPGDAERERIEARFRNGVLKITIPRMAAAQTVENRRRIEIKKAA